MARARIVMRLAPFLVALLVFHHPVMGAMPIYSKDSPLNPAETFATPMSLVTSNGVAPLIDIGHGEPCSSSECAMSCPLMTGIIPECLRAGGHDDTLVKSATIVDVSVSPLCAPRRLTGRDPPLSARIRRAFLQIFRL